MTRAVVVMMSRSLSLAVPLVVFAACAREPAKIPEIHGRVVDARTSAPIGGAIVKRRLYRPGPTSLVDGSRPFFVEGGDAATTSDSDGRFILPPFSAPAFTGMAWLVYASGWMPAYACYSEAGWPFGGCSGFGLPGNDPWTSATFRKSLDRLDIEVRVFPPTLEGVVFRSYKTYTKQWVTYTPTAEDSDPWANYFGRLNSLCEEQWLPDYEFVHQAVSYAQIHAPSEGAIDRIHHVLFSLGGENTSLPHLALPLARIVVTYCDTHPSSLHCARMAKPLVGLRVFVATRGETK